jgi:hypothetical protein
MLKNPLENFKELYGTGAFKLTEYNKVIRVGGVNTPFIMVLS